MIDGGMRGKNVSRSEEGFSPGLALTVGAAVAAYRERAAATDATVRSMPSLTEPCRFGEGRDLRWVLLHLINETARHAGHADAIRAVSRRKSEGPPHRVQHEAASPQAVCSLTCLGYWRAAEKLTC